jgi:hypothetical protein
MEYPPNSDKSKLGEYETKKVERVTSSEPIRRKKSLGKSFRNTFFGGDMRGALQYVALDVLLPSAREMISEAGRAWIDKLVFGDSRRGRGVTRPSGPQGYVSYNRYAMGGQPQEAPARTISRRARSMHDFDEIVLSSRREAEDVIDRLFDLVGQYGSATVSDLYELVGLPSTHTDNKWGWEDARGAGVTRVRNGYLLDLPEPEPLTS